MLFIISYVSYVYCTYLTPCIAIALIRNQDPLEEQSYVFGSVRGKCYVYCTYLIHFKTMCHEPKHLHVYICV